ncbi:MAG: hypothetical protein AB1758_27730 [Candidatus Eremiobacterota bacterium]
MKSSLVNATDIGEAYLGRVEQVGSRTEATVASVARDAVKDRLYVVSAEMAVEAALESLAAGVPGPLSVALGKVGSCVLDRVWISRDERTLGFRFLEGVARTAESDAARSLAQAAVRATHQKLFDRSAAAAHKVALSMLNEGVPDGAQETLAEFGCRLADSREVLGRDIARLGRIVLQEIAGVTEQPWVRELATVAADSMGRMQAGEREELKRICRSLLSG